ncbi:MAG: NAD(P)/FAD-dependent oxidoreductase [Acidiferrobacterales bacterium]
MNQYEVIVIGAGAAGLMCAITAGKRGRKMLVLERANKIGKKILMSGGGRCNFTNLEINTANYLSANPHFCKSALSRYTQHEFIALVEQHGIPYHEKADGQLFCDHSSKDIVALLRSECEQAGVTIKTDCDISKVEQRDGFHLETACGDYDCDKLVVASGGLSVPTLGGSDIGYRIARQFGHEVLQTRAGLVPFVFTDEFGTLCDRLAGISVRATVSSGTKSFTGDILFTHRGLSGPAILQLSSYWREGSPVLINLLPDAASDFLVGLKHDYPRSHIQTVLSECLPKRLAGELLEKFLPQHPDKAMAEIPNQVLQELQTRLQNWRLVPAGTEGYRTAEVTLGGVDTSDLSSKTMESRLCQGLYFIGEVVDVTGHLGGFNFQWAWASGFAAGNAV